ncbi:unnamed protein product [Triticum turgidum subsp. durum]|uniref:Uncharacterized protein n=1 Tax=Triticum turgidum subsp. durum TaxID=4567 RepID=A0A9R1QNZ9_TRITD|nr:unnamed protein product [Triticum turgidum subsp. durum]
MPYPAAVGAGHPPHHERPLLTAGSDSNAHSSSSSSSSSLDKSEWRPRSPVPADPFAPEYLDELAGYFVEAAGRLPIAQIPFLACCMRDFGLAIGFADPVTNIILTTIDAFAHAKPYMMRPVDHIPVEQTRNKTTFADGARSSWIALNWFLVTYFRHLTVPLAVLLLRKASYDLRVAVEAVHFHVDGPNYLELLALDSVRTKTAFEEAVYPQSSAPELLRLMTSSYSRFLAEPVLEDLHRGGQLTADCVYKVSELLRHPWSPPPPSHPPPPSPGIFRDDDGSLTMTVRIGDDFATTHISTYGVATTTFTSSCPTYAGFSENTTNMLSMFPTHHGRLINQREFFSETLETPEFLPFLKLQLLDMIHGVYLKAIAMLPVHALRNGHLLHSLVTAGHCYGPLDPVSNIVINTVWYDVVFPLSKDVAFEVGAADILDVRSMHRVESRSIDGLVAYLRRSPSTNEQDAVTMLCKKRLNTPILDLYNMCDVALAAKHPQPAAFGAFLERASILQLYDRYCLSRVHGHPDSAFEELKMALLQETTRVAVPVQQCAHDMDKSTAFLWLNSMSSQKTALVTLSEKRLSFRSRQDIFRRVLEHLLIDYGYRGPLEPLYKLGVICGVTRKRNYSCTDVYHANFLASSDGGSSWKLFFAEFWNLPDERLEESKNPFCCPVPDYHEYPGRCVVCENDSSIIMHPQSRKYYMGNSTLAFPTPGHCGGDTSEKLDFDFIYLTL